MKYIVVMFEMDKVGYLVDCVFNIMGNVVEHLVGFYDYEYVGEVFDCEVKVGLDVVVLGVLQFDIIDVLEVDSVE